MVNRYLLDLSHFTESGQIWYVSDKKTHRNEARPNKGPKTLAKILRSRFCPRYMLN